MVNQDSTAPGYILYFSERHQRLLLPTAIAAALAGEANLAMAAKVAADKEEKAAANVEKSGFGMAKLIPQHENILVLRQIDFGLDSIRTDTRHDLSDAMTLATRLLARSTVALDAASARLSYDLLVAISMTIAYERGRGNLVDVLDFLRDPEWDSNQQMFWSFYQPQPAFEQADAAHWMGVFRRKIRKLKASQTDKMAIDCYKHWTSAGYPAKGRKPPKALPTTQVFAPDDLARATVQLGEQKDDRRDAGARTLQNAHASSGNRTLPDAKAAHARLESAKSRFENLVEPIERLQTDLVLAGAMQPSDFRITPLLLLGAPGIGKTFLATQLAEALGVSTEKISAGGAQGAFQLVGSHTSWTGSRPGMIFSLLANGDSAAPVVVIDEVDKIRDAQYPVLPALLDLLDPATSKKFHDEFFELRFDASRIVFVLTANSIEHVPPALLSRVEVFNVPAPGPAQRLRIIQETAAGLRIKTKREITLDEGTAMMLSERVDIDLRRVARLVNQAFAQAMQAGSNVARIASFAALKLTGKRSAVFH
ncbi:AAA family ATPase [Herbaspirillum sp. RTI4]|uniref:AAA family ATPase n=1 Tax=Herbaspirillum sp. RTI4 TaxID=3048640 RepID=UPI002AB48C74|nr:AAA family ATPase [Herbaspirillum sp. RTI4]MDY7576716.1 AAA family ATPase [Herbaspirillum sp. RTI4]MEA9983573.1 AAA family ATPase [Herbaspirillum sp. RTI4]